MTAARREAEPVRGSSIRYLPIGVSLVVLALYVTTVCPTVPFGDGGELIAAAACLGVAHPPGYPLYTALGRLALALPIGEPALRMNLMSSLFGALTCGVVAWLLMRLTARPVGAVSAALALSVSATFWWVATTAEVYTLHLLLLALLLAAGLAAGRAPDPRGRTRALTLGACVLGLGLGHHPTILLGLPAAAIFAWRQPAAWRPAARAVRRWLVLAAVAVTLPVLLDLSLLARARLDPPSNWGQPVTLEALWTHVSAASYRHFDLGWAGLARAASWQRLGSLTLWEFTPAILPLALLGLVGGRADPARPRLALIALIGASAVFGLRYTTEDVQVFYLPIFLGLALAAGRGVALLCGHARGVVRAAGLAAAVLLVALPLAEHARSRQLRGLTAAADYGRDLLRTVPEGGVLFVEGDDSFILLYLHQVLGERPDVTIYDRHGVLFRDVVVEMDLSPRPGETLRYYGIRAEQTFLDRELSRPGRREILFLGWPGYDVPPVYRLEPVGLLYRICLAGEPVRDDTPLWAAYAESAVRDQAERVNDSFGLALAATYPLARGERALFLGDRAGAYAAFERAGEVAGRTAGVHRYIGTLYGRIGDYARAIESFERSLAIKPVSVEAWNNLGMAYERSGDLAGAARAWRRSLGLIPGQQDVVQSLQRVEGRGPALE